MAAVGVGCFLPWAKVTAPFVGTLTRSGMEGGDGIFFLAVAAGVAVMAIRYRSRPIRGSKIAMGILLGLLGAGVLFEILHISGRFEEAETAGEGMLATSYGAGLWLVGIGTLVGFVAWAALQMPPRPRRGPAR